MTKHIFSILLLLALPCLGLRAQSAMSFADFMARVSEKNASYLVEKYNIDIATANEQAARVVSDPELSLDYSNNEDWSLQMGQSYELGLGWSFSFGNVRGARMKLAETEKDITVQAVSDFFNNLRSEAAAAYAEAWASARRESLMKDAYENMRRVASGDSLRLVQGDLSRTDALQSSLEAKAMRNEYLAACSESRNALHALSMLAGGESISAVSPELNYNSMVPALPLEELIQLARDNRSDLKVAELTKKFSNDNLRLVNASRAMEMGVSLGYSYNTEVRNEIAPAPKFNGFTVGVSIPLKFSSMNRGEKAAAKAAVLQSEKAYEAAVLQIDTDVMQAYNSLRSAEEILRSYDSSILSDAAAVLESRSSAYRRGDSPLYELLAAQRSYNEIAAAYVDACAGYFCALAEMERALAL